MNPIPESTRPFPRDASRWTLRLVGGLLLAMAVCGPAAASPVHITIHHMPGPMHGPRLLVAPTTNGWDCVDIESGDPVVVGSMLDESDPSNIGVECTPPAGRIDQCNDANALVGTYHNDPDEPLTVTLRCDMVLVAQVTSNGPLVTNTDAAADPTPVRCEMDDGLDNDQTVRDWWAFCQLNVQVNPLPPPPPDPQPSVGGFMADGVRGAGNAGPLALFALTALGVAVLRRRKP